MRIAPLALAALLLYAIAPALLRFPFAWRPRAFSRMLAFGSGVQVISVALFLFEPSTRLRLAHQGGLELIPFYDAASKLVQAARNVVVNACQAATSIQARLFITDRERCLRLQRELLGIVLLSGGMVSCGLFLARGPISFLWLGKVDESFVLFTGLLVAGWFVNTVSAPGYFLAQATATMRGPVVAHLATGGLNVALGIALGTLLGPSGVVLGTACAIAVGSLLGMWLTYKALSPGPVLWPLRRMFVTLAVAAAVTIGVDQLQPLTTLGLPSIAAQPVQCLLLFFIVVATLAACHRRFLADLRTSWRPQQSAVFAAPMRADDGP